MTCQCRCFKNSLSWSLAKLQGNAGVYSHQAGRQAGKDDLFHSLSSFIALCAKHLPSARQNTMFFSSKETWQNCCFLDVLMCHILIRRENGWWILDVYYFLKLTGYHIPTLMTSWHLILCIPLLILFMLTGSWICLTCMRLFVCNEIVHLVSADIMCQETRCKHVSQGYHSGGTWEEPMWWILMSAQTSWCQLSEMDGPLVSTESSTLNKRCCYSRSDFVLN